MDLVPGGSFLTRISENGGDFTQHIQGCFLAVDNLERIVFTTALVGGWRPAEQPFITAIITLRDHPTGTDYKALVMHKNGADRAMHDQMGFQNGWGTVITQLANPRRTMTLFATLKFVPPCAISCKARSCCP